MNPLPPSWALTRLGDLHPTFRNGASTRGEAGGAPTVVLRLADVVNGRISLASARNLPISTATRLKYCASHDDVLVIRVNGSTELVGRFIPCETNDLVFCDHFIRMKIDHRLASPRFLTLLGSSPVVRTQIERAFVSTAGQKTINQTHLRSIALPLPPRAEQDRIVAAIEEKFSRLDAGVGAVERAVLNLKRMRGAVLQATITGTLVSGDGDAQGVAALLDELLESRREASGKSQRRYVQPVEPLPSATALPSQWAWVSLDMLSESAGAITDGPFGSNLKSAHYAPSGPRVIRLQNIGDGEFLDAEARISQEHFQSLSKHAVRPGDLVCALLGETTPRAAIVPDDLGPAIVKADCPRVRLSSLVNHRFVWAALNAPSTRREASARIHGVGRPRLNLKELRQIPIPLPPRAEQDLLVDAMDRQLDAVYRLEADLIARRDMSEALRSSILTAAFSGVLVQQDPNDEPAPALLQRIAAEGADARDGYRAIPHQRRRKASV